MEIVKQNDELFFNLLTLSTSTLMVKALDEYVSCKRCDYGKFSFLEDFWAGTYGNDLNCLRWKSFFISIGLFFTLLSLICLTNQLFQTIHCFDEKHCYKVKQMIHNLILSTFVINFGTKVYTNLLQTAHGQFFHGTFLMIYCQKLSICDSMIEKYSLFLQANPCYFSIVSNIRSRSFINKFKTKQIN